MIKFSKVVGREDFSHFAESFKRSWYRDGKWSNYAVEEYYWKLRMEEPLTAAKLNAIFGVSHYFDGTACDGCGDVVVDYLVRIEDDPLDYPLDICRKCWESAMKGLVWE